jgi:hypothetical protein
MVAAHPWWRTPRIRSELKLLGIAILERPVSRILRSPTAPPEVEDLPAQPSWPNGVLDFLTVPTIRLKVLFVLLVREHGRREVLHFNLTAQASAIWTAQQIVAGQVLTAPPSPWQNSYVERLIGLIRTECLNHFLMLNARHLKRT